MLRVVKIEAKTSAAGGIACDRQQEGYIPQIGQAVVKTKYPHNSLRGFAFRQCPLSDSSRRPADEESHGARVQVRFKRAECDILLGSVQCRYPRLGTNWCLPASGYPRAPHSRTKGTKRSVPFVRLLPGSSG